MKEKFFLGDGYLYSGYGVAQKMLETIKTKTKFLLSENFRRLPDDAIFTGEVRLIAKMNLLDHSGINVLKHNTVYFFYYFTSARAFLENRRCIISACQPNGTFKSNKKVSIFFNPQI